MLDSQGLSAFVAVAESRSFSRAADQLAIAQSLVSKRLSRLEDRLGGRLIERGGRSEVRLTRLGAVFLPEAKDFLAQMTAAEIKAIRLCRGERGPIRIGYVFSAAMSGVLTSLLSALRNALPEIEIEAELLETPEQLAALEAGKLDIGLVRPRPSYPAKCRAGEVHSEELVLCLSEQDALAAMPRILPAMLGDQAFIVPQFHEKVGLIDNLHALAKAGGFRVVEPTRTKDFVTAVCLAAAGNGVVLAPQSLARLGIEGVCFRQIEGFDALINIALLYRTDMPSAALRIAKALTE
jgi:DNA-binding transcriptional LysR family regulator